jgi:hypothetical protein
MEEAVTSGHDELAPTIAIKQQSATQSTGQPSQQANPAIKPIG